MTKPPSPLYPAEPVIKKVRKWLPSMVWIVPLLAALIGISLVVQSLRERGPTIIVSFPTAEGIEVGKTKVKFKDVDIGEVTALHLADDHSRVLVTIDLLKEAQKFAAADTRFWVAKPRLAGGSISGLETLLSGVYIAVDSGSSTESSTRFVGLESPPVVASDVPGRRFKLLARDIGSLDIGSPVYFRRIPVGHVESFALDPDGRSLSLGVFIKSPYDHFVTADSRFWHASGIDLRLDAGGLKLDTQSLASIVLGGVAFETPVDSANAIPSPDGTLFPLAGDHSEALKTPDGNILTVMLRFHQSIRGLAVGAPVDFRGVELGQVRSIGLTYDKSKGDYSPVVILDVFPDRLTAPTGHPPNSESPSQRVHVVEELVQRGLRAQLRPGNLLTGQPLVALDFFPNAPASRLDTSASPLELPTVPSDLQELYQQVQAILLKLEKVPFDTLAQDAHRVMTDLDGSLKQLDLALRNTNSDILPEVKDSLEQIRTTVQDLHSTLSSDSPLQQDTRQALQSMAEAARSLKTLSDNLERQPESLIRGKKEQNP